MQGSPTPELSDHGQRKQSHEFTPDVHRCPWFAPVILLALPPPKPFPFLPAPFQPSALFLLELSKTLFDLRVIASVLQSAAARNRNRLNRAINLASCGRLLLEVAVATFLIVTQQIRSNALGCATRDAHTVGNVKWSGRVFPIRLLAHGRLVRLTPELSGGAN
jgi:hypothetical protein